MVKSENRAYFRNVVQFERRLGLPPAGNVVEDIGRKFRVMENSVTACDQPFSLLRHLRNQLANPTHTFQQRRCTMEAIERYKERYL